MNIPVQKFYIIRDMSKVPYAPSKGKRIIATWYSDNYGPIDLKYLRQYQDTGDEIILLPIDETERQILLAMYSVMFSSQLASQCNIGT